MNEGAGLSQSPAGGAALGLPESPLPRLRCGSAEEAQAGPESLGKASQWT